ncbi:MAG: hypothetical protein U1F53_10215 [Burkholderiaceae bacterium]
MAHPSIPIIPVAGPVLAAVNGPDCAGCHASTIGPVCRSELGQPCLAPTLVGPEGALRDVLGRLSSAWAAQLGESADGLVQALTLTDDEADLTLAAPACGLGARLADVAFHTLRRALPDTDIYVHHAVA